MTTLRPGRRAALDLDAVLRLTELSDYITPFAIRTACALGVADALADGPRPAGEIAQAVGAAAGPLRRMLRALAAKGVFAEPEPDVFALTPLAQPLRTDHPFSLRDTYALLACDVRAWARLAHTTRTGEAGFARAHGQAYWDYLASHPDDSASVDRWMESATRLHLRTVLPAYAWSGFGTVVDVGGGTGAFLAGLLRRFPAMRGVLFDLPHVVAGAPAVLAAAGVADRCEVVAGDFLVDAVPAGADAYVLKTVLPGFDDRDAVAALRRVRAAMRPDSRLLALEAILPEGDAFDIAKLFDVHTMVLTGGAHRTLDQMRRLLRRAGLHLTAATPTVTLTVLEGHPDNRPPDEPEA